ncbi:MAG: GNAT family N-acetyltransferase [Mycobacteriales bacterium]
MDHVGHRTGRRGATTGATARDATRRVLRRLLCVHTFDILARSTEVTPVPARRGQRFELHRVTGVDSVLLHAPSERDWPVLRLLLRIPSVDRRLRARRVARRAARLAKGDVAYVATAGQAVAAWAWVSRLPSLRCRWSGLRFTLHSDEAYLYDLWSFPSFRTAGAGAVVMRGLLEDLHRQGEVKRVYGYVERENRPSQVLHRIVLGFEQVQQVKDIRVLSRVAWQLPFTDRPSVGPCSRPARGRSTPERARPALAAVPLPRDVTYDPAPAWAPHTIRQEERA